MLAAAILLWPPITHLFEYEEELKKFRNNPLYLSDQKIPDGQHDEQHGAVHYDKIELYISMYTYMHLYQNASNYRGQI